MSAASRSVRRLRRSLPSQRQTAQRLSFGTIAGVAVAALTAAALLSRYLTRKAEQANPPTGRFLEANGVRLHYVEHGKGDPVVLVHGNGSMIQDFEISGLIELVAKDHRVIVFDRPGFGHSTRPRNVVWTPDAQAAAISLALTRLGVTDAIVLGHSWGASVAIAMALKDPHLVRGLVLASGYYYPTFKPEVAMLSAPSLPLVGDVLSHTLSPLISRAMWPIMLSKMFAPKAVPGKFKAFPKEMALRPSQIRASAVESALMIPDAFVQRHRYAELKMPVVIIAGGEDQLIDVDTQSGRLHSDVAQSSFVKLAGHGHMIHQTAVDQVASAISRASQASRTLAAAE